MTIHASSLTFLKLGGSLITHKSRANTVRRALLERLCQEVAGALEKREGLQLIVGHGSGSFGHVAARQYGTRQGVRTRDDWRGFARVWERAAALNHQVLTALHAAGVPAVVFPPSAGVRSNGGQVKSWDLAPLQAAMKARLVPVVYGDVVFDEEVGGTILSTEDLFVHLAQQLSPSRILLAGQEPAVWSDYPARTLPLKVLTPADLPRWEASLQASADPDVTGGMASKVSQMLALVKAIDGLEVLIFSGEPPGQLEAALLGARPGTLLRATGLSPPSC